MYHIFYPHLNFPSIPKVFERCGAIIFVIDAQDDWNDAIAKFTQTVSRANAVNPKIKYWARNYYLLRVA